MAPEYQSAQSFYAGTECVVILLGKFYRAAQSLLKRQ